MKRRYESQANSASPVCSASDCATSGVIPTLRTVSIMPGIENFAPERTETKSGFFGSPNFLPNIFSSSPKEFSISPVNAGGIIPEDRNSRHA